LNKLQFENSAILKFENIEYTENKTNIEADYKKISNLTCSDTASKHLAVETLSQIFSISFIVFRLLLAK